MKARRHAIPFHSRSETISFAAIALSRKRRSREARNTGHGTAEKYKLFFVGLSNGLFAFGFDRRGALVILPV
jgi:hypothetical protein